MAFDRRSGRAHDAPMRAVCAATLLVLVGMVATAVRPDPISACVGRILAFEDAIRMSDGPIYAGRITRAEYAETFWMDVTIDIDIVVRGPAATRVRRAQAGDICDGIRVGEWGYIVRGVRDPHWPGTGPDDVFFAISRSKARTALSAAGLPNTSSAVDAIPQEASGVPWAWLAVWFVAAFAITWREGGRRRRKGGADTST